MAKKDEKYNYLENVLQDIIEKHIALNKDEEQRNNKILKTFLDEMIKHMKNNSIFKKLYIGNFYGGSYYDGIKITKPDEYDLDFVLQLPDVTRPKLSTSAKYPEYVQIRLGNINEYEKQDCAIPQFSKKFLDHNNYLSSKKILRWMRSVIYEAFNKFQSKKIQTEYGVFHFQVFYGDPAFTVKLIDTANEEVQISIDLVPCFVFTDKYWPGSPFRQNEVKEQNKFFIVPQQADPSNETDLSSYWRLSFQQQERSLIKGFRHLKPALMLIKRLRDVYDHKYISSYCLKTIFLCEVHVDKILWDKPLSYVFVRMLKRYKEVLENGRINNYWDERNNLLEKANSESLCKFAKNIQRVIEDIENYTEDTTRIARHMVKAVPEHAFGYRNNKVENLKLTVSDEATTGL